MLRKLLTVALLTTILSSTAAADEFYGEIMKIDDGKLTIHKAPKGIPLVTRNAEVVTIPAGSVKLRKAKWNGRSGKYEPDGDLPGGIQNEQFRKDLEWQQAHPMRRESGETGKEYTVPQGVPVQLIVDDQGKISEIWVRAVSKPRVQPVPVPNRPPAVAKTKSTLSPKELASFEYVMLGMKDNRERLKTGVFRATGLYSVVASGREELRGPVEIFSAFDRSKQRIRFDRSVPIRPLPRQLAARPEAAPNGSTKKDEPAKPPAFSIQKTQVILSPKEVLVTAGDRGSMRVHPPEFRKFPGMPFDVRALGLNSLRGFEKDGTTFEERYEALTKNKPCEIERQNERRWKIVWEFVEPTRFRSTYWIDEASGFTVIKSETRLPRSNVEPVAWGNPEYVSDVTWERRDDVWVPKSFKIQDPGARQLRTYDLAFEWESVNKPIADNYFTIAGMDKKDRTEAYNVTTGKAILREVVILAEIMALGKR